jgi:hypothetical protein
MARKSTGNKSEAIRAYLSEHPEATPSVVVPALAGQGVKVTAQLVSSVKSTMKARGKKRGRRGKVATQRAAARNTRASSLTAADLVEAKNFADRLGGVDQMRKAIDLLEQLR